MLLFLQKFSSSLWETQTKKKMLLILTYNNIVFGHTCFRTYQVNKKMIKACNKNPRKGFVLSPKLTIKIPERRYWSRSGVFIVNSELT